MSNIVKGTGIIYTTGKPNTIPSTNFDAEFAIDTNGSQYAWNKSTNIWDNIGQGIEVATSSIAPSHIPSNFRPRFVVTPSRDLYFYSSSWSKVNPLPNGVVSSSAQIDLSRTGIYSGSNSLEQPTYINTADGDLTIGDIFGVSGSNRIYIDNSDIVMGDSSTIYADFQVSRGANYVAMRVPNVGDFYINDPNLGGMRIFDLSGNGLGLQYHDEYSDAYLNDRSLPDVGVIRKKMIGYESIGGLVNFVPSAPYVTFTEQWNTTANYSNIVSASFNVNKKEYRFSLNGTFVNESQIHANFTCGGLSGDYPYHIDCHPFDDNTITIIAYSGSSNSPKMILNSSNPSSLEIKIQVPD